MDNHQFPDVTTRSDNHGTDFRAVYALHETDGRKYSWMNYASVLSLKLTHPEIAVRCFVTDATYRHLRNCAHPLLEQVDMEVVDVPLFDCNRLTSRCLKIVSGMRMDGSFVFLDSDTLVVRPIRMTTEDFDIAATPDKHTGDTSGLTPDWVKPHYAELNWDAHHGRYYNSGVVFYHRNISDTGFFSKWLDNWKSTCGLGFHNDQPSFNHTMRELGLRVIDMGDEFNAMVQVDEKYLREAVVMHFYESTSSTRRSKYDDLVDDLRSGGRMSGSTIVNRAKSWNHIYYDPTKINLIANGRYREILFKVMKKMRLHQPGI